MRGILSITIVFAILISCNRDTVSETPLPEVSVKDIDTSSFSIYWDRVKDAKSYILSISKDSDFKRTLLGYDYKSLQLDEHKVDNLQPDSTYYCRLKVNTFYGVSDYTPTLEVRTKSRQGPIRVASTTHNSVSLWWNRDRFAEAYYQLDLSTTKDFSNIIQRFDKIPSEDTTLTIQSLQQHATYYARLRSVRFTIYTYYAQQEFRTRLNVPTPNLTEILDDSFSISWNIIPEARSYTLQVSTILENFSPEKLKVEVKNIYNDKYTVRGLDKDKTYYYRLAASSNYPESASLYSSSKKVVTGSDILSQKFNFKSTFAVTPISFGLSWESLSSVGHYTLDVSTTEEFEPGTVLKNYQSKKIEGGVTYVEGLEEGKDYYCRLQAHSDLGSSLLSDAYKVTTIPRAPTLNPQQNIFEDKADLLWTLVPGATSYLVDVATDENFSNIFDGKEGLDSKNKTEFEISGLSRNATYYVRVRAKGEHGISSSSNVIEVRTK